jgi:hypothetical protein
MLVCPPDVVATRFLPYNGRQTVEMGRAAFRPVSYDSWA